MVLSRAFLAIAAAALWMPLNGQAQAPTTTPSRTPAQSNSFQHQRVQQIIQNVEKAYQNGISNYRDGHLAAAKSNFDYAVDQMLTCGIPIKSDADLSAEFDRIVDAVNTLEMDALKQGTGLAAPAEPTPVDVANDVTFPVDPGIKAEAEAQLKTTQSDLPLVMNDPVASFINFFSNSKAGHGTIVASLDRAGRYKEMIQRVLKEEGVPQDLIYQAVAESGFRPQAVNPRSGAGGMWQFMPFGVYGLSRTGWYDERFDPEKATRAYAREMKKNYDQLGDWYLAMAAYDWGAGNVQRAQQSSCRDEELRAHHPGRHADGEKSQAIRPHRSISRPSAADRHGADRLQRRSALGIRRYGCPGAGDRRTESQPAADGDSAR
jgi:membrane-bound lytic murein transglycosylase D